MDTLQPSEIPQDPGDSMPAQRRIGRYRLESELGAGGMADVYRAIDERLGRAVAVKYLPPPFARERFRLEAAVIAHLSHPAIVEVYDVIENDAGGWIVMELVDGRQLSCLIAESPLDLDAALPIFNDLAGALAEAHAKGILHRDLKAENVMVTPAGRAKLLDFGLARWLAPLDHKVTLDGQIVGTPHAMSPEQAMSLDLDHRSDVFSLGSLFYESLTGVRPFQGAGIVETIRKVCVEPHRPCHELSPGIPRQLSTLIDRMLEKEPERRLRTAGLVARKIDRLAGVARAQARPGALPRQAASGERPTITVVHCELASSGSRAALDPEELAAVRPELERIAARAAARFDGEIDLRPDPGLRLIFRHPREHGSEAARRAVYAAREIVAGVEGLIGAAGERLVAEVGEGLGIRAGIHTGPALVVPGRASATALILGATGDLAAVVQRLAAAGEILLSRSTHDLVNSFFVTGARPPERVARFPEPVATYRWLDERRPKKLKTPA